MSATNRSASVLASFSPWLAFATIGVATFSGQAAAQGCDVPSASRIAATAHGWPNGRTVNHRPSRASDGNCGTFTWTTQPYTTARSYLGLDFGRPSTVDRIRFWKIYSYGEKNLSIEFTTSSGSMAMRTWLPVSGMTNGVGGNELLTARTVGANGQITGDTHDSPIHGWASLSFDQVVATGVRIGFTSPTSCCNHLQVYELEAHSTPRWSAFGTGCSGLAGTPRLDAPSPPVVGATFVLRAQNLVPSQVGVCFFGSSDTAWSGGGVLPLGLTSIGMAGCSLYVSPEASLPLRPNSGSASVTWLVPGDSSLIGVVFYNQLFQLQPGANPLGVVASNAGRGEIGT